MPRLLIRYTHLRAEDLVERLGLASDGVYDLRYAYYPKNTHDIGLWPVFVCASFGFFPPIVLPRWLAPAVHHEKVITKKSQTSGWVTLLIRAEDLVGRLG